MLAVVSGQPTVTPAAIAIGRPSGRNGAYQALFC
jgi:hypothetical protein